ncbi:hypothetical protein C8R47DRAFT_999761 [Mycena vitilis]|nr:hypothetical protein C8R47DRAFT_999761 [Mycena vitilis]
MRAQPSNFLYIWRPGRWPANALDVCAVCLTKLHETHDDAREAFWAKLPKMYGLPAWPELKEMKAAAIGPKPFG